MTFMAVNLNIITASLLLQLILIELRSELHGFNKKLSPKFFFTKIFVWQAYSSMLNYIIH